MSERIFTVVSRPGPVEERILGRLAPIATDHRALGAGVSLRALSTKPGAKTPVVLLHGRGHGATVWEPFIRAFAPERRVLALDLPGFGHSGFLGEAPSDREQALARFVDPIEAVVREQGPAVVVGHSLGGLVALELALRRAAELPALVLIDAMGLGPYVTPRARAYLRAGPERLLKLSRLVGKTSRLSGGVSGESAALREELYLARGVTPPGRRAFDALLPLIGAPLHRRDRLGEVTAPTLLVWGERDEAFPLPVAVDARARMPEAVLSVIDAGHSPHLERPTETLEAVRAFLQSRGL
ncbi:MAG: alpha/beta fold hydrolase [Polyangiaceae bacterium]|nr:alpha/beta fold hydrolase [Polyangiaceae bacterium]